MSIAYRPSIAEGWCQSCVHYNSLGWGWGIESLGFSVVLNPMSASLSTSLRADYGGALDRCVAIFGRADQHSAGAEGAPYRLSIESYGMCSIVRRWKECGCFYLRPWAGILSSQSGSPASLEQKAWLFVGSPCCPALGHADVSATNGYP
eukprot:scaffold19250_cov145-Isochrysis_galbana.AAC.2